ncbi:phosphatidic acid phosphatase type 2/haloperoxidase [Obelidium mucronatum]|nr:phosphatidic acid phosphatase type 2/haloperoxidase [Obelidium mucronatum]
MLVFATGTSMLVGLVAAQVTKPPLDFPIPTGDPLNTNIGPLWLQAVNTPTFNYNVTSLMNVVAAVSTCWYDCWAIYDPVASCVSIPNCAKRPAAEGTVRDINICMSYSTYTLMNQFLPGNSAPWDGFMQGMLRLNVSAPYLNSLKEATTSAAIGVKVGNAVSDMYVRNELNAVGDRGLGPYGDWTGFVAPNPAEPSMDIDYNLWQPLREHINASARSTHYLDASFEGKPGVISRTQTHVTPQIAKIPTFLVKSSERASITIPPPSKLFSKNSYSGSNDAYVQQAREVVDAVALTYKDDSDYRRALAEHNENKIVSLGLPLFYISKKNKFDLKTFIHYVFLTDRILLDTAIIAWDYKLKFKAVRPITAIHALNMSESFTTYLNTMAHAEYPSGSSTLCQAYATVASQFLGTDEFGYYANYTPGSSFLFPGKYPIKNVNLEFPTFSEMAKGCGESRLMAGVHFKDSIEVGWSLGAQVGKIGVKNFEDLVAGKYYDNKDDKVVEYKPVQTGLYSGAVSMSFGSALIVAAMGLLL